MSDVIENVKKDLQSARLLCKTEFKKDNPELVAAVASLIAEERRRQKRVFPGTTGKPLREDPVEVARKSPRRPALPIAAIGQGTKKASPAVAVKTARKR